MVLTMSSSVSVPVDDRDVQLELLVDLVAADLGQVVALRVEEQVLQQRLRGLARRRLARAQLAVDVEQGLVAGGDVVLLERGQQRLRPAEVLADALLGPAEGLQQHGDRLAALAVDADTDGRALVDVELEPGAAARNDLHAVDVDVGGLVERALEVDARRTDELADDDPLGAVDDERALAGHHREVTHEHRLRLDLAGGVVDELRGDEQRGRVGHVLVLALLDGGLDLFEARVGEGQAHGAREVLDRGELFEDLLQTGHAGRAGAALGTRPPRTVADQPVEGLGLQGEEVGNSEGLADLGEGGPVGCSRDPGRVGAGLAGARSCCQGASFQGLTGLRCGACDRYRCCPLPIHRAVLRTTPHGTDPDHAVRVAGHAKQAFTGQRGRQRAAQTRSLVNAGSPSKASPRARRKRRASSRSLAQASPADGPTSSISAGVYVDKTGRTPE